MTSSDAYAELVRRSREVSLIQSCSAVLGWDQQTYMPRAGAALRGDQLALLAGWAHQKATDPVLGELLAAVEGSASDPDSIEAANVRELRHAFDRSVKIPARLVEELARITTLAQDAWQQARAKNHFATFRPLLERVLALKREEAAAVGYVDHPYDALLDEYEPGATTAGIRVLFSGLEKELVPLIRAEAEKKKPRTDILHRDFPIDRQKWFAESAAAAIELDFQSGRIDTTAHTFCSAFGPGDCRLTTRYNPKFFNEAFFGVLHEAGHGMYEQGLLPEHHGTPAGTYCSLGIHESQSRFWENQIGRSKPFWDHFFPRLKQAFPGALDEARTEDFLSAINAVEPSFIRVEADEATYNLHILLRFELELALLSGDLAVADLPGAWNEKFEKLFGLVPKTDSEGCLQDIHWSFGGFGYFPTYTLGNLYAAQFGEALKRDYGESEIARSVRVGDFRPVLGWLRDRVHRHGRRYRAERLCERATGAALSPEPFLRYLKEKLSQSEPVC